MKAELDFKIKEWIDCNLTSIAKYQDVRLFTIEDIVCAVNNLSENIAIDFSEWMQSRDTYLEKKTIKELFEDYLNDRR